MGTVRARPELRVKLRSQEPRMIAQFDNFDEAAVGREPAEHQSLFGQVISIAIVELVPMTMTFRHFRDTVKEA